MKGIKFLLVGLLFVGLQYQVTAQRESTVKTQQGKIMPLGSVKNLTTTNATPVIIDSLLISDNTAGTIEVTCVGSTAAGEWVSGTLIYRWFKTGGDITVDTANTVLAVASASALSGATFAVAESAGENIKITITGKASKTIKWRCYARLRSSYL